MKNSKETIKDIFLIIVALISWGLAIVVLWELYQMLSMPRPV